ncbi:hypothetical protein L226DRAFT_66430 [Lentinus tigrinus ALCF2SS1-7]|uniref:DUF6534 domain-containing protein n=1 Tax=Lentinus tigrinus ALCF2SS1-6 TaxID=1328759 RepID=A0A5C2S8J9_9APHY|nr:hypothetical protein L227DRAFT_611508 [Lentinus tigrinus ALCF2SS1-6]RPD74824.1 hypothetical protein L226DRAFT_66430 [Lentinus tigrinus ALCF2SS1-7]
MGRHYDDNLGALLIGQMISTFLYGISTLQTYVYLMTFPRDRPELKLWVMLVWGLDSANVILVCHGLYYWAWGMVIQKTDPVTSDAHEAFAKQSFYVSAVLNLVAASVVQCFFIIRIYKLCQTRLARYTLPTIMSVLVLAHLALGAEAVVKVISTFRSTSLASLSSLAFSAALPYTLLAVLSDVFLAGTLTLMSRGRVPLSEKPRLHSLVHQSVTLLVHRCVLLSVAALVRLIVFTVLPWTAWFIAADFIMGKLYANSFVACLNARTMWPNGSQRDSAVFSSVPDISVRSNGSILPASYSPTPRNAARPVSRAVSLPELVFCKHMGAKAVIPTGAPIAAREICPCLLTT